VTSQFSSDAQTRPNSGFWNKTISSTEPLFASLDIRVNHLPLIDLHYNQS